MKQPKAASDLVTEGSPYYAVPPAYGQFGDRDDLMDRGFGLFELIGLLRRRWEMVLAFVVIGTASAVLFGLSRPAIYSADAKLLIEPENRVVDLDSVVEGVGSDAIAIETQMNLLQSRGFLERFVTQSLLGVSLPVDVLYEMKESADADSAGKLVKSTLALESDNVPPSAVEETSMSQTVDRLARSINVSQQGRSFIIELGYSSPDASEAARLANELAEFYIEDQANRRRRVTSEASRFLEERLSDLEVELLGAEEAVQAYRSKYAQRLGKNIDTTSEQILDLTSLLVRARADRKEKETRLEFISSLKASGESLESLTEVLSSRYMATLWEQDSMLRSQEAELRLELGDRHPKLKTLAAERRELSERIDREIARIIENTRNELDVLVEREKSLEADLQVFTGAASDDAVDADRAEIQLRLLEGNAEASRRIYEEFLLRLKETRQQEAIIQANTRLLARAQIPTVPSSRSPLAYALMGLLGSCVSGVGIAYLRDRTDRKIRSGKEINRSLGLTFLGLTPLLQKSQIGEQKIHEYLREKPASLYAETIRSIFTKTLKLNENDECKVILVTSSVASEGKTTFAVSLATLLAADGQNVVLIDLDLRRPSISKTLDLGDAYAADDYFAGQEDTNCLFLNKHESGFRYAAAKKPLSNPGKALRSSRLRAMIASARKKFDHVIIDSAPSLGLSDSKALIDQMDAVIFVVKWNETNFETVSDATAELRDCNCPLSGVVLTQVDIKKQARYGYGGIDDYYGSNSSYYKD